MQQDQQSLIIQDQPLKVLGLFPKRTIQSILFDEDKFQKLYNTLCCTICQQLFNNPVYLKCSHRFCKQCLEKYIRFNQKKSCPNCRGDLNTKRDLKLDFGTNSLINYAYGNRNKFCQSLGHLQSIESQNLHKLSVNRNLLPPVGLIRTKSFAQQELKSPKKKVKTIQGQKGFQQEVVGETRGRKKKIHKLGQNLNKPIQLQDSSRTQEINYNQTYQSIKVNEKLMKTDDVISPVKNQLIQFQKQQYEFGQFQGNIQKIQQIQNRIQVVKKKRGRKKKVVPILVMQNKSIDLQVSSIAGVSANLQNQQGQIDRLSDIGNKQQQQGQQLSITKKSSFIAKSQLKQSPQKLTTFKPLSTAQLIMETFQKQRNLLNQQFGQNYMLKMMRIPILNFLIQIKLQRHPQCYFTPLAPCKSIQLSGKCKLHQIYVLLAKLFNVSIKNIIVYVSQGQSIKQLTYKQNQAQTILQINQIYWKSAADVQVFDMKEILSALDENNLRGQSTKIHNQNGQIIKKKKLFEGINLQRQQKILPKKRGRGRTKKVQQKQNPIEIQKDEPKRILYYRLVIQ